MQLHGAEAKTGDVARGSRLLRDLQSAPNLLSLSRIVLTCVGVLLYIYGFRIIGLSIGVIAALTDYLDGYIARRTGKVTELGGILDRLSDLVIESTGLIMAMHYRILPPLFFILYLLREFFVISARLYCADRGYPVPSSYYGKLKTNFLLYAFLCLYLAFAEIVPIPHAKTFLHALGTLGVGLGLVFSYVSGYQYLRAFATAYDRDPTPRA
ncbi:MAG: CDP-alcohol phosphatidyltransferase family protein [Deltaproteobacteria bacterium]|nr:CDP-alcohol phosphatidyltransferase family protein [Deltaproteobacteria bacterium]